MSISLHKPAEPSPGLPWPPSGLGKACGWGGGGGLSFSFTERPHPHTAGEHKACPLLRCLSKQLPWEMFTSKRAREKGER